MAIMLFEWVFTSAFLILVVLALRAALGKRMSAGLRYGLWAVVLVRLLVPVALYTAPVAGMSVSAPGVPEALREDSIYVLPVDSRPAAESGVQFAEDGSVASFGDVSSFGYPRLTADGERVVRYADKISPLELLGWIWIAGAAVMGLVLAVSNLRFYSRLRRVRRPMEGVSAPVPVYVAAGLPSPCLMGVLRPAVYVTEEAAADPAMLRHVLAHELTHYRHLDHWWSVLRGGALAVHWWNPLVWLAVVCSRRDGELACDEGALKTLDREERRAYGETLLALVTAKPSPRDLLCCATTMSGEKRSLKERIRRIACEPKQLVSAVIAAAVLVSATAICAFGRAEEVEGPDAYVMEPVEVSHQLDLNRDGISEIVQVLEKTGNGTPEWRLEVNQGDTGIWSAVLDETHGSCGTYFLYRKDTDYLLEYMPKMQQGYCTYSYRLFHIKDGMEITDQERTIEFDINFNAPDHIFDPQTVASFMNEVNALIRNSELLLNTNHWMLHLEEDSEGRLYDNILAALPHIQETDYRPETLLGVLQKFASYSADHPDDTNSPLGSLLSEIEAADLKDQDTAAKLVELLRDADRLSRFYEYGSVAEAERWSLSTAVWAVPLADSSTLHIFASDTEHDAVHLILEAADSISGASYRSAELHAWACEAGEPVPTEILPYAPDLDHDGKPEELRILTGPDGMSWVLRVIGDGWHCSETFYQPHVGWNSVFLCRLDGQDYLLRYQPYMSGGVCEYQYKLYDIQDGRGAAEQENKIGFDLIFAPEYAEQHVFEPKVLADFMGEINALLADSVQLMSTDIELQGTFEKEGRLYDSLWWMDDTRDESLSLLENLLVYRNEAIKAASAPDIRAMAEE